MIRTVPSQTRRLLRCGPGEPRHDVMGCGDSPCGTTHLGEGRRADLAVALPLLALGRDDVVSEDGETFVYIQWLRKGHAAHRDVLDCIGIRNVQYNPAGVEADLQGRSQYVSTRLSRAGH